MGLQSHHLIDHFQTFYADVLRQKERALRISQASDDGDHMAHAKIIQESLRNHIQGIYKTMQQEDMGGSPLKEALYIMVALADEIFLNLKWVGISYWSKNLLERQFFDSQISGEMIFKSIDGILSSKELMDKDLATLYHMTLSLGFLGKYRGQDQGLQKIEDYKNALFIIVTGHKPRLGQGRKIHLMEEPYDYNLSHFNAKTVPSLKSWGYVLLGVLGVYIFASYMVWYGVTNHMDQAIHHIFESSKIGPLL